MEHPIIVRKLDRSTVLGEFRRVGSTDPDILQATRSRLLASSKPAVFYGWGLIILGIFMAITILGLPIAIIAFPMGLWGLNRAKSNIRTVDAVFHEVTQGTAGP